MDSKIKIHLTKDHVLKKLIHDFGELDMSKETNIYKDIIESIISQQLSVKAADTISKRFTALFGTFPSPEQVVEMPDERIRECGISYSKIKYIKGFCQAVIDGQLDLENLQHLSDEEVLMELIKLKGIGNWTAEMILMFTLNRPDVFSMGDLGLRNAVSKLYLVDRDDFKAIEEISLKWSPYRSYASRYLWKSLDNTPKKEDNK